MAEDKREESTSVLKSADSSSSYRSIFKATSLFGGVQIYQILIDIIRSKFIALLLGPAGVGIQGLYTSATQLIQHLTSFGLSSSAVRNVAEAYGSGDKVKIAKVVFSLRRLVWLTGLLGTLVVIIFSPLLSISSFGDSDHIIAFIIISITLLLAQLSAGQKVILQGTRQLKLLAKSTALGATLGLVVSVPLYYWLGIRGIVPNIVISAVTTLLLTWYYSSKVEVDNVAMASKEVFQVGKTMLVMGIAMSLSHILTFASSYVLRACIRVWDGVEAVGFFTAGFLLMNQYTGLVFKAMGTDFYPRLAAVNQDNYKCKTIMNQQGEIGLLILAPLLIVCIVFIPLVVKLLYSEEFLPIEDYIIWCSLGMLFKMASWSISYVFVAKGESKSFMIVESTAAIYTLLLNLMGYKMGGLIGIGVSFTISYIIYLIQVYIIASRNYDFSFERSFINTFVIQFILLCSCIACVEIVPNPVLKYALGVILTLLSAYYSLIELDKRIGLKTLLNNKIKRKTT